MRKTAMDDVAEVMKPLGKNPVTFRQLLWMIYPNPTAAQTKRVENAVDRMKKVGLIKNTLKKINDTSGKQFGLMYTGVRNKAAAQKEAAAERKRYAEKKAETFYDRQEPQWPSVWAYAQNKPYVSTK